MPVNKSSLRFYLMGRCYIKVIYQKCVFFKYWKRLLVKKLPVKNQKELLSIIHRLRVKQTYVVDLKRKFDVFIIQVATGSLLDIAPS